MATILLVDDSPTDRRLIGGILERKGLAVRFAENGVGALKQLERQLPDAVLTDMQMPEMDGLELVKAIRLRFPQVPVILMTGHGSETLAAQALQQGAASYVPKTKANKLLVDSVNHVLELARGDTNFRRLIDHTCLVDFHFELRNDADLIEPLITLVQQMIGGMNVCDPTACLQVGVALEQAILNAMYHGNLELSSSEMHDDQAMREDPEADVSQSLVEQRLHAEPYESRRVFVRALTSRDEVRLSVRDQGKGFDVKNCLDISLSDDESVGRGLVLMWALMDKVVYNKTGNEVTLIKRRSTAEIPLATETTELGAGIEQPTDAEFAAPQKLGQLVPLDGGRSIQLTQPRLSVGRSPACDIVLGHSDVSHEHCLLYMYHGWWYVKDLKSANGTRINKGLIDQKRLAPGAVLGIATHQYEIRYSPWDLGAEGITPPVDPF